MKKIITFLSVLFIIINLSSCGNKNESAVNNNYEKEKENKDTVAKESDDIPSEYKLKRNIPDEWYEPLPESEHTYKENFFNLIENSLNKETNISE